MKKILFLLFICVIKLCAWELILTNNTVQYPVISYFTLRIDDDLVYFYSYNSQGIASNITPYILSQLNIIKNNSYKNFITNNEFENKYKSDINILNDLYLKCKDKNYFLNYLYNSNNFSNNNYIEYDNYELFYNEDGLAIESKVNGVYKGLYDDIGQSGILYNSVGEVVLVDGVEPSFLTKQWLKLQNKVINPLLSVFSISNIWKNILCVVVILASLRMLIRYAFKAFLIRLYSKRIKHYENTITRIENA